MRAKVLRSWRPHPRSCTSIGPDRTDPSSGRRGKGGKAGKGGEGRGKGKWGEQKKRARGGTGGRQKKKTSESPYAGDSMKKRTMGAI